MLRVSPQKLNLVAQLIRGRKASAALRRPAVLAQADRGSTSRSAWNRRLRMPKTITTLEVDDLVVAEAHVGNGIVMKRFAPARPWPLGPSVYKPFSHLTIVVRQVEAEAGA